MDYKQNSFAELISRMLDYISDTNLYYEYCHTIIYQHILSIIDVLCVLGSWRLAVSNLFEYLVEVPDHSGPILDLFRSYEMDLVANHDL